MNTDTLSTIEAMLDRKLPDVARAHLRFFLSPPFSLMLSSIRGAYRLEHRENGLCVVPLNDEGQDTLRKLAQEQEEVEAIIDRLSDEELLLGWDALVELQDGGVA